MHKTTVTYFTWLHDELITIPDFPAWICDICGKREYDHEAVRQINLLFNPLSERWKPRKHAAENGRSMEEEARQILKQFLLRKRSSAGIGSRIAGRFAVIGGVDMPAAHRSGSRRPTIFFSDDAQ